ncbi:F-box/LRR-repeat protein [Senna tora]|uniref:F-box/LRR-repeat protein n=1 Tax=Senna tora TaxID=362788 RepID=A0A834XDL1_9FABA|nr:F-box/LRR-repeat protein [Senna tora]
MSSRIPHGANSTIKIDNSDKIFCFPKDLWHHILFLLPLEDAVTTSSVSKAMLKAWTSLPILEFHFDHKDGEDLGKFVRSINDSLSVLKQHRAFINTFSLKLDMESEDLDDLDLISDQFGDAQGMDFFTYP